MELTPNFVSQDFTYRVWKFPSGEVQVQLGNKNITSSYVITGSILSSDHLMELLQLKSILGDTPCTLIMPYCAYSRQDRVCNPGEALSIKVFANLINSCNFDHVITWDNHSDVSTALINNCLNKSVDYLIADYEDYDTYDYLVSPDAGANKKVFKCSYEFDIPMIRADKVRDTTNGNIVSTDVYASADRLDGKTILIVDDICQGGRTFVELAKAIKEIQPSVTIHLYVTHGFFNNGFNALKDAGISKFITTKSVPPVHRCNELKVI